MCSCVFAVSPRAEHQQLFDYLLRYDAVTFHSFLVALRRASAQQRHPSLWLTTVAADRLFEHAKVPRSDPRERW